MFESLSEQIVYNSNNKSNPLEASGKISAQPKSLAFCLKNILDWKVPTAKTSCWSINDKAESKIIIYLLSGVWAFVMAAEKEEID